MNGLQFVCNNLDMIIVPVLTIMSCYKSKDYLHFEYEKLRENEKPKMTQWVVWLIFTNRVINTYNPEHYCFQEVRKKPNYNLNYVSNSCVPSSMSTKSLPILQVPLTWLIIHRQFPAEEWLLGVGMSQYLGKKRWGHSWPASDIWNELLGEAFML